MNGKTLALVALLAALPRAAADDLRPFLDKHCTACHDADTKKGNLDLTALPFDAATFAKWVTVHDRAAAGEMPPKGEARPPAADLAAFTNALAAMIVAAESTAEGRATRRRLNRTEYEDTLRDLLALPYLEVKAFLPEDGEAHGFNKVGDALDVSHVQLARYLAAGEFALRQAMLPHRDRPATRTVRYYARDQRAFVNKMKFSVFNQRPERATFPVLDSTPQPDVRAGTAAMTDPATREREAVGVAASTYEPLEVRFEEFRAPASGRYKLRFNTYSVWVGPGKGDKWFIPDLDTVSIGRRPEPVTVYAEVPPRLMRRVGAFDAMPEPGVRELVVDLHAGETIRPDAARLFRSRPPGATWHNPLAEPDGQPGVAFRWLEVEGPLYDQWPTPGHALLFADLPATDRPAAPPLAGDRPAGRRERRYTPPPGVTVTSADPDRDADRLLRGFLAKAYRRPVQEADVARFLGVIRGALKDGHGFTDAMLAGYTAVLSSPAFLYLDEKPGPLDDRALADRLAYFLTNAAPDDRLRRVADAGFLRQPAVLRAQTERLLDDPKSRRFVNAFLDYWLDLRLLDSTGPDAELYPDYYLDDLLVESMGMETQLFFGELLRRDLGVRNLVDSDFAVLNERLATHYGLPGVGGVDLRPVPLPKDSVRGGLLTQASVLKVTANGTTTTPVKRGAWVMGRLLGQVPPPPPASVPAVEPDTRGATTIREQLAKHRTLESCAACHKKIDPAGFALEGFDVMGGARDKYRALGSGQPPATKTFGHNGQPLKHADGPAVDASGELPDGRKFADVRDLKRMLASDEETLAKNLVQQLAVYATGAPVRFSDRAAISSILDRSKPTGYGVRTLVHELVQSELFLSK
ncbi:MAG: DUF1592 domain-containing protein [Gemmataceae bacterium]